MSRGVVSLARKVRPAWWVLLFCVATAGVWQRYEVVRMARTIELTQGRITVLRRLHASLSADCSRLAARERIEAIAVKQLGMSPTTRAQKRTLLIDTSVAAYAAGE
jgi:cell division protein FtsL